MLFTADPVDEIENCLKVTGYYAERWLNEEFYKAWKGSCKIEERNLQKFENIEQMMAIAAPIAVRIVPLRSTFQEVTDAPCDVFFFQRLSGCVCGLPR